MCVHMACTRYACICIYMWKSDTDHGSSPQSLSTLVLRHGFSLNLEHNLARLVDLSITPETSSLYHLSIRISGGRGAIRIQTLVPLACKHFTDLAISPAWTLKHTNKQKKKKKFKKYTSKQTIKSSFSLNSLPGSTNLSRQKQLIQSPTP